jgi:hypothetical protein
MHMEQRPMLAAGNILFITFLPRWLRVKDEPPGVKIVHLYRDEYRKVTSAKWKLKHIWSHGNGTFSYLYRLDGRSIRYMRRVVVIDCCLG